MTLHDKIALALIGAWSGTWTLVAILLLIQDIKSLGGS